ncbi:MAG: nucleotidyltransferase [Akkermansiaceae bacterium]|nr:nucleotidyltransferase [Akkermansiaceae bacterium]
MGSRYGGLKQLDPMGPGGETILDYSVFDAIRAGFGKVVFVIREDFAKVFREQVGDTFADRIEVDYAYQRLDDIPRGFTLPEGRVKPWGTAHAVRAAREVIAEPFAVINADDFYGRDAYVRAAEFLDGADETTRVTYCLVGYYLERTLSDHGGVNRGLTVAKDGLLQNVEEILGIEQEADGRITGETARGETRTLAPEAVVSMNFWGFTPRFFTQLEEEFLRFMAAHGKELKSECYIPTVVDDLVARGDAECHALATTSSWFGVTYPDDKPHVVRALAELVEAGEYPASLRR